MKVGDLIRIKHDETYWLGHGIVLEIAAAGNRLRSGGLMCGKERMMVSSGNKQVRWRS